MNRPMTRNAGRAHADRTINRKPRMKTTLIHTAAPSAVFAACALLGAGLASAQSAPGAGELLQQVRPAAPQAPSSGAPLVRVEGADAAAAAAGAAFEVRSIRITGNTLIAESVLRPLVQDAQGRRMTLSQLSEVAARITARYAQEGYPLSRAIVPAQVVRGGEVELQVVEARYGRVELANSSRVREELLRDTLSRLRAGEPIARDAMDRSLLLLADVPGIAVNATVRPGDAVGTSDLVVQTVPTASMLGQLGVDNQGNRYTGRVRASAALNLINPAGRGDVLSLNLLSSGSRLSYGRAGYDLLLGGAGTRAGGAVSVVDYRLGDTLAALQAHGTALVLGAFVRQPLVRTRDVNVSATLQLDRKVLRDRVDSAGLRTDRTVSDANAVLAGDARDALLGGAVSTWSLGWMPGRVRFDDAAAQAADAASARSAGRFNKINAGLTRLQALGGQTTLYLSASAQWADSNLDGSEKLAVGGPSSVRAYDTGAMSADSGYRATAELRQDIATAAAGRWQASAFVDTARVTVNHQPWVASANSATLSGAGLGLSWAGAGGVSARLSVATRLGGLPVQMASTSSTRAWADLAWQF